MSRRAGRARRLRGSARGRRERPANAAVPSTISTRGRVRARATRRAPSAPRHCQSPCALQGRAPARGRAHQCRLRRQVEGDEGAPVVAHGHRTDVRIGQCRGDDRAHRALDTGIGADAKGLGAIDVYVPRHGLCEGVLSADRILRTAAPHSGNAGCPISYRRHKTCSNLPAQGSARRRRPVRAAVQHKKMTVTDRQIVINQQGMTSIKVINFR